jgi:hypothetical protein
LADTIKRGEQTYSVQRLRDYLTVKREVKQQGA